jgi:hypothetical protein
MTPQTFVDDSGETLESAVAAFLDVAVVVRRTGATAMVHCHMCGGQDENHESACPVPMLEQWLFDAAKEHPEERAAKEVWAEQGFTPM